MSNNEDTIMTNTPEVISNTPVVETRKEIVNPVAKQKLVDEEIYQTVKQALTTDMNSLVSEVGTDNNSKKNPVGKLMFNQEKNVLTWYKNLVSGNESSTLILII